MRRNGDDLDLSDLGFDDPDRADPDLSEPDEFREWPHDTAIDSTKAKLKEFFRSNKNKIYYDQQIRVLFEEHPYRVFQWITGKALTELREEGFLKSILLEIGTGRVVADVEEIRRPGGPVPIRFFWLRRKRYWRHDALKTLEVVRQFSNSEFGHALGSQGELLADLAMMEQGFAVRAKKVRTWKGKKWAFSGHDLDRVYERDGNEFGCEIKNTLGYIPKDELIVKLQMCKALGLRPLVIARSLPPHYVNMLYRAGGLGWIIGKQLYPFGYEKLAAEVRRELGFRVSCAVGIEAGAIERFGKAYAKLKDRIRKEKRRARRVKLRKKRAKRVKLKKIHREGTRTPTGRRGK
jgi:hypothetical protein